MKGQTSRSRKKAPGAARTVRHIALTALFAALIAAGAWLSLPVFGGNVVFSFQLLAVFLAAGLLPVYDGAAAVAVYLVLGTIGLPVFAGFRGGFPVLVGPTGGFILGFLPTVVLSGVLAAVLRKTKIPRFLSLSLSFAAGLIVCYLCGWVFFYLYLPGKGVWFAARMAILPYLPVDLLKVFAAALIVDRVEPYTGKFLAARRGEKGAKTSAE